MSLHSGHGWNRVRASTGFTTCKAGFGRGVVMPVDVMLNVNLEEAFDSLNEYVQSITETLSTVVEAEE